MRWQQVLRQGDLWLVQAAEHGFDDGRLAGREFERDGTLVEIDGVLFGQRVFPDRPGFAIDDVAFKGLANDLKDFVAFHSGADAAELAFAKFLSVAGAGLAKVLNGGPGLGPGIAEIGHVPEGQQDGEEKDANG